MPFLKGIWQELVPPNLEQLHFKGDIVVGNDVWTGRKSVIMPGVKIGDGAITVAYSIFNNYSFIGGKYSYY